MSASLITQKSSANTSEASESHMTAVKFHGRVLLLEDDELLGSGLSRQLAPVGIETIWTQTVEKAKLSLKESKIHAIVTDIYLKTSGESGLDLIADSGAMGIPIIVITSNANLQIAKKAMNEGASYLLEKPFEAKELVEVLNRLWMEPKNHIGIMERFFEINGLTSKEREISRLLLKGLSNAEIASALKISDKTVKFHLTTIFAKSGVQSRTELYSTIFPI